MKMIHFSEDELDVMKKYHPSLIDYVKMDRIYDEKKYKLQLFNIFPVILYEKYLSNHVSDKLTFSTKIDVYDHIAAIVWISKMIYQSRSNPKKDLEIQIDNANKRLNSTNKHLSELDERTIRYNKDEIVFWEQISELFNFFNLYIKSESYI
jgi:hypothetical protein